MQGGQISKYKNSTTQLNKKDISVVSVATATRWVCSTADFAKGHPGSRRLVEELSISLNLTLMSRGNLCCSITRMLFQLHIHNKQILLRNCETRAEGKNPSKVLLT